MIDCITLPLSRIGLRLPSRLELDSRHWMFRFGPGCTSTACAAIPFRELGQAFHYICARVLTCCRHEYLPPCG